MTYKKGKLSAIRNPDGIWINTEVFREEAKRFLKRGYYTADHWGTPDWFEYWKEQRKRCIDGYTVGGAKITGEHYFYLNFLQIKLIEDPDNIKSKKIKTFPDFWDGDFNYFWVRQIAKEGILNSFLEEEKEKKKIISLSDREQIPYLTKLVKGLNLEVKIPSHKVIKGLDNTDIIKHNLKGGFNLIAAKSRRKGYFLSYEEVVHTPIGKTTMRDIKVGDEVLTPTGKSVVKEKYEQGIVDIYKLTLYDGRTVKCGLTHLWRVYSRDNGKHKRSTKVVDTKFLLDADLKPGIAYKWFLPINEEVINENIKDLPIPPYTMGAILGDSNVTKQFKISGIDEEVFEIVLSEIKDYYEGGQYMYSTHDKCNKKFNFICSTAVRDEYKKKENLSIFANRVNPVYIELKKLGLNCKSKHKYIPDVYKYHTTVKQRYDLVKGLMDTDGSITKKGFVSFCNTSKQLVEDLQEVLYSLGISSVLRKRKDGLWIIYINTNIDIFNLIRKKERVVPGKKHRKYIAITKVEKLEKREEAACIEIECENHLFLTNKYVVTHNSYKSAAIAACNYFTKPDSYTIFGAYEKKFLYPKGLFNMCKDNITFVNDNTAWSMPSDYVNRQDHIRASYKQYKKGIELEKGFMSEIQALTFKDNADAARGKDAEDIFFEEAGAFGTPGLLKDSYAATQDCVMDGLIKTGMITLYGTSGDISSGTADFADMFSRPYSFGLLPFYNVWDESSEDTTCGFFHPINWNLPGFYDKQGNSDFEEAKKVELNERRLLIKNGATSTEIQKRLQQKPFGPVEAFSAISQNNFPVVELRRQLQIVKGRGLQFIRGTPVELSYKDGVVNAKPILNGKTEPITSLYNIPIDKRGTPVIYELPVSNTPKGLYKIGYDPIRQDEGTSLAGICVYKGVHTSTQYHSILVAEYIGRMESADDIDRIAEMFADLYNTTIMYENEVTGVKNYFRRIKRLNLLAGQPDLVISKNIKRSKVSRVYGCHMSLQLKDAGERYIKDWLLSTLNFDENGDKIIVIDKIYSIRLLEELIAYNRKGNFDLVSSLIMCMFQVQEEAMGKKYSEHKENKTAKKLLSMIDNMYVKK